MEDKIIQPDNQLSKLEEDRSTRELSGDKSSSVADVEIGNLPQRGDLVLVVDDAIDNIVLLSLQLQSAGYRVITASNGEEAIKVASLARPNIILMDIGMPVMDGLGAMAKIRELEELRNIPVIAVTGFTTSGFRHAAFNVGFDGYVTKPIEFDQVNELIRRLLFQAGEKGRI